MTEEKVQKKTPAAATESAAAVDDEKTELRDLGFSAIKSLLSKAQVHKEDGTVTPFDPSDPGHFDLSGKAPTGDRFTLVLPYNDDQRRKDLRVFCLTCAVGVSGVPVFADDDKLHQRSPTHVSYEIIRRQLDKLRAYLARRIAEESGAGGGVAAGHVQGKAVADQVVSSDQQLVGDSGG